ncbi:MAG: hypothetical protein JWR69_4392 [Pedosphaera sp.]|nr:hypothetical protein [Pedosphaera sp.]
MFVSMILFVLGGFMLCYCPGEYVLTGILAGVAIWLGSPRVRAWSVVLLVASLVMMVLETRWSIQEKEHFAKLRQRFREAQRGTNELDGGTNNGRRDQNGI